MDSQARRRDRHGKRNREVDRGVLKRWTASVMLACAPGLGAEQPAIPAPQGFVNDFAAVIDAASASRIARLIDVVRAASGGEIAVVTLKDLGGREAIDVATRIGRDWGVGAMAPIGDRRRNAGTVILVVPKETSSDGRGHVAIAPGTGAEGFIPDAVAGDIQREAISLLTRREYGPALALMTARVAKRYSNEFGFSLDSLTQAPTRRQRSANGLAPLIPLLFMAFVLFAIGSSLRRRGRRTGLGSALPWIILGSMGRGGRRSGRGGGWGGGGWGGGGGGGFGGFGGGGGFSGGGSSGSW
jgi:uncharacterized protein